METIHLSSCPICGSSDIHPSLTARDQAVSGEEFEINECRACSARFTQNIPGPASIGKYYRSPGYISHTDTREGIVNKLYHAIRRITLVQKKKLVEKATGLKKGMLLDVGAGTGLFVRTMQQAGWNATGLEPDEIAREKGKEMKVLLRDTNELLSLQAASYDVITLWHALEHVHDLHSYLAQFRKLLNPSGQLIIAVPNYTSRDARYYAADWAAYDVPRHLFHFSPASMKVLLAKHGFNLKQLHPQWFDSFYVSLLSEKYKTGKTRLFSGGWQGLLSDIHTMKDKTRCSSLVYIASLV